MCFHSLFAMFEKSLGFQPVDQGSSYGIRHNVDVLVLIWWFISIYICWSMGSHTLYYRMSTYVAD